MALSVSGLSSMSSSRASDAALPMPSAMSVTLPRARDRSGSVRRTPRSCRHAALTSGSDSLRTVSPSWPLSMPTASRGMTSPDLPGPRRWTHESHGSDSGRNWEVSGRNIISPVVTPCPMKNDGTMTRVLPTT